MGKVAICISALCHPAGLKQRYGMHERSTHHDGLSTEGSASITETSATESLMHAIAALQVPKW